MSKVSHPVMIRVHGKSTKSPAAMRDIVAIFPTELGDARNPNTMVYYSTVGEHGICDSNYAGRATRPATKEEQERMLKHLSHHEGYENLALKVISRPSSSHRAVRAKQVMR